MRRWLKARIGQTIMPHLAGGRGGVCLALERVGWLTLYGRDRDGDDVALRISAIAVVYAGPGIQRAEEARRAMLKAMMGSDDGPPKPALSPEEIERMLAEDRELVAP